MAVIECHDLTKAYSASAVALDHLTLAITPGMAFGLLGENGAGKSTLVKLIMGFIFPTSGHLRVLGEDRVARAHTRIGYAHERPIFELRFSGRRYLRYLANLAGLWDAACEARIETALVEVGMTDAADRATGTYSKGMLQRLAIAQALLTDPDLLLLDEPTSGLDPRSQWEVRQIIATLRQRGKTILLCSHSLPEVEALCDTVGILRHGKLILHGAVADLLHAQDVVAIELAGHISAREIVERLGIANRVIATQDATLRVQSSEQRTILAALTRADIAITSLNPLRQTLEDVYVQATQQRSAAIMPPETIEQGGRQ
jgi:ABC-2 type transport system ATP-binding protein